VSAKVESAGSVQRNVCFCGWFGSARVVKWRLTRLCTQSGSANADGVWVMNELTYLGNSFRSFPHCCVGSLLRRFLPL
jgi:hypothetical protein